MTKKLMTPKQEKRMWRNAAIRTEFKSMQGAVTAIIQSLADKYDLTTQQIRTILKEKELV